MTKLVNTTWRPPHYRIHCYTAHHRGIIIWFSLNLSFRSDTAIFFLSLLSVPEVCFCNSRRYNNNQVKTNQHSRNGWYIFVKNGTFKNVFFSKKSSNVCQMHCCTTVAFIQCELLPSDTASTHTLAAQLYLSMWCGGRSINNRQNSGGL